MCHIYEVEIEWYERDVENFANFIFLFSPKKMTNDLGDRAPAMYN